MADPVGFSQENRYISVSTPLDDDALILRAVRGSEAISDLFHYELEMVSEDPEIDFSQIIGQTVTAKIEMSDGETARYVDGLVTEFSQHDSDPRFWTYRAVIRPKFWLGTRKVDCRIFQEMSVTDIAEKLLGEIGVTDYSLETTSSYDARDYCVQYNETVFDFLNRLFEDEGIYYFHKHEDGKHTLVIADDADAHPACEGFDTATYRPTGQQGREDEDAIIQLSYAERVVSDHYAAEDYNFETPSTDLSTTADGDGTGSDMEVYEYPGGYSLKANGDSRADIRIQEFEAQSKLLEGRSSMKSFTAGYTFSLIWHGRESLNDDYVLSSLSLRADNQEFENSFAAYPKSLAYRPARRTRRPRIHGTQTAVVTGKSGEEIWTDEFGRVKVQFHWDREGQKDENTSCWVRVAQGWAGKSWGSWFLPRIGMEVVVSFLEGDPDRPIITGCVYNGEQVQPYTLPDDQTKFTIKSNSSKGGGGSNELRFEDKSGEEEVYLHAQKDWNSVVENERTTTINESDDTLTIEKGNRTSKINTGNEDHYVKGTRTLKIDGAQDHTTGDGFTHAVTGDYKLTVSGDLTIDVDGNITIKAGQNITVEAGSNIDTSAGQSISADAGMNMTNTAGQNISNSAGMNMDNEAEMNLTNKGGMNVTDDAGMNLTLKSGMNTESTAGMSLKEEGSMSAELKGGMSLKAEGGMTLDAKGGLNGTYEGGLNGTLKGGVMAMLSAAIAKLG
ncbi:MAG: type VI secretion system tip protein TssI/VgrG [Alphaproteobacteria bacterium]